MAKKTRSLVGKIVAAIYLADDKKAIRFDVIGEEPIVAFVDGDCCSDSWIENVENPDAVIGHVVTAVDDIDTNRTSENSHHEVIQFYGLKIETSRGTCVIDYRNSSNGYYGGNLSWPGQYFYGGAYGQNVSKENWKLIASDGERA